MNNLGLVRKPLSCLLGSLWPQPCVLCQSPSDEVCCPECRADLLPPEREDDHLIARFSFDYPLNHLIHALKYHGQLALAPWFAKELFPQVISQHAQDPFTAIIAMPLHPSRLRERGFNQSHEIARWLSKQLKVPLLTRHCHRLLHLRPQAELSRAAREQLPSDLFVCDLDLHGAHVLLVDDVVTTGTSLARLRLSVERQGAAKITCAVVARTHFH